LVDAAEKFAQEQIAPLAAKTDKENNFPNVRNKNHNQK